MAALLTFNCFCNGIGTGGTIAGTGQFMKMMNPNVMIVLADPEGSGLYNKVRSTFLPLRRKPINDIPLQFRSSSE
jgi:cysteine synthase